MRFTLSEPGHIPICFNDFYWFAVAELYKFNIPLTNFPVNYQHSFLSKYNRSTSRLFIQTAKQHSPESRFCNCIC
jgi:hypothetical protein